MVVVFSSDTNLVLLFGELPATTWLFKPWFLPSAVPIVAPVAESAILAVPFRLAVAPPDTKATLEPLPVRL